MCMVLKGRDCFVHLWIIPLESARISITVSDVPVDESEIGQ